MMIRTSRPGLFENLSPYDVRREGECLAAYLDGKLVARSRSYTELLADIKDFEQEYTETPTFLVSWIVETRGGRGYIEDSKEVQAHTAAEAIKGIQSIFPDARQLSATLVESKSFAEEFKLIETLWT